MHGFPQHRISRVIRVLSAAALLAVFCTSTSLAAGGGTSRSPQLGGTWKGRYSGSYSGTFTIRWRQLQSGRLKGQITLSNPAGSYGISGTVHRGSISFGVVAAGATYSGTVSGKSMSGHYKTGNGGSGTWSAHKTS